MRIGYRYTEISEGERDWLVVQVSGCLDFGN